MYIIQLPVRVSVCVCVCIDIYIYMCVCECVHSTVHIITCTSNFHLRHTILFCKNIWERSILWHSKLFGNQPNQTTRSPILIALPQLKNSQPRLLLLGDSPVTAWPGSLRRLLSLRAASAPAAENPFPVPSLGQGAEPDTVANALLRPGCFNVWILVFVFQGFSNTYCGLVKLVQYSEHCFQMFFFEEQRDGWDGSSSCCNPMVLPVTVDQAR